MSGEALLDRCLAAHGGLDPWRQFGAMDVDLTTSGLVFATHGQRSLRTMARVATREPLVVLSPYRHWPRGVFQRDRVFIEDASGRVMAERKNPYARMGRERRLLWWDTLDTLYFVGYALSNYVHAPFLFAQNGFQVVSAGVATFASGTWSKLRVTFPVGSQFLTARAAARHMVPRGRGAIVFLSASLTGQFIPFMFGITAACGAVEALSRTLATEFGPAGVRVNCVRAGGMPETRTIGETTANMARRWA